MSFRVRVIGLLVFLAATSTAATAWLTVRQATEGLTDIVKTNERDVSLAVDELAAYARTHGTWDGIAPKVADLSDRLGQRLRLVDDVGEVVVDSDVLHGRTHRPVTGTPWSVDPRPSVPAPQGPTARARYEVAVSIAAAYRDGWPYAACLTRAGVDVRVSTPKLGVPVFEAVGDASGATQCERRTHPDTFLRQAQRCTGQADDSDCLRQLLTIQIGQLSPPALRLYVGALGESQRTLPIGSIAVAAVAVVIAAALCAILLGGRVVRPVSGLTAAARRLGSGNLAQRVPVTGRDEIAALAREFNRMAESLAASEERQRQLIADVAHELRTPLANLRGYLEGLADGVLEPDKRLFASLHEETLLQQRIVDDLQDLALAEAGALAYHRETVDLVELIETSRTAHAAVATTAGVALTVDASHTRVPSATVDGDPDRLRQVIGNVLRNAITATPLGGQITVSVTAEDVRAVVRVRDTGRGIPPDDLPHVFDRLWRADSARARSTGAGSGLGLAIARQIVVDHGGTIEVSSAPGSGTEVTISLPLG